MGEQKSQEAKKHICAGLLAHVDAGKTTLSEGILYLTGSIRRLGRVDNRDAFLDNYELERSRGITIFSKQAVCELGDTSVTLLDTPGHVDFSAEMERTLQVLDCAILIVSGADGVQGHTETLWRLLSRYQIPVFLFVNKMDQPGTEMESLQKQLKERLDENCIAFGREDDAWLESLAMCGEEALEAYLETGSVPETIICRMIAERRVFPCYYGSALKLQGVQELLDGLLRWTRAREYGEQFGAKVFKISRDAQGNRLTHMKITGGNLRVRELLEGEKINQIRVYSGEKYETLQEARAGMICAVTGPVTTRPGQGIGTEPESELPLLEPVLTYRLELPEGCDPRTLLPKLRMLEEEAPELHLLWQEETGEIQVQVMGEVQTEILQSQIADRFGVEVSLGNGRIVYKETICQTAEGVGHFEPLRHYAEVHLLLEPAEPGSGIQIDTACSEDLLDRNWQRLILTHLEERQHRGILTGSALTDVKITLIAGRAHQKHTEGGDFRQATYRAVRQGLYEAGCRLLEPYYTFRLQLPGDCLGRAMTDLERMSASLQPPEAAGDQMLLTGRIPAVCIQGYQKELVAYTKGRGQLSCILAGYFPCHNQEEVVSQLAYDPESDLEHPSGSVFCAHGAGFVVPWYEVKAHMHVESPWKKETQEEAVAPAPARPQRSAPAAFGVEDRELEEIFARTYGAPKRRQSDGPRRVVYTQQKDTALISLGRPGYEKRQEGEDEYLLVDGYNIIYAWEELRELAKETIDGARHRLMDILSNYHSYRQGTLILVFDAYKVSGSIGSAQEYHNIHVVYTKEAETADQYIEKLAHQMGRKKRVTVATSDGLEQLIIHGQGCILMSAKDLKEDVERIKKRIEEDRKSLPRPGKNYLFGQADAETAEYLENVRLGKTDAESRTVIK